MRRRLIKRFGKKYAIYPNGTIVVLERVKPTHKSFNGYVMVSIDNKKDSKPYYLHRLVAETFLPRIKGKEFVNHIDGNKQNNDLTNLEWCTHKENLEHAWRLGLRKKFVSLAGERNGNSKLRDSQIEKIKKLKGKQTLSKTAKQFGIGTSQVWYHQNKNNEHQEI